jgi:hypothetical protein
LLIKLDGGIKIPKYESICYKCGKYHEYITTVSDRNNTPLCCGEATTKSILSAPVGIMDFQPWQPYESPASGKMITSKAERRADFKATKTREWEGMETERQEQARQKAYEEADNDKKLDAAVGAAWASLSPQKKAMALKSA